MSRVYFQFGEEVLEHGTENASVLQIFSPPTACPLGLEDNYAILKAKLYAPGIVWVLYCYDEGGILEEEDGKRSTRMINERQVYINMKEVH